MIKGVTRAHSGPIWYDSEPSDVPYFPNQFFGWDFFGVGAEPNVSPGRS